jgi:hypothetical protein
MPFRCVSRVIHEPVFVRFRSMISSAILTTAAPVRMRSRWRDHSLPVEPKFFSNRKRS